jgi:putative FmdB family regulatory protein
MPLYEFECEDCKTRFERIQKFTDPNPDVCPACGKNQIRRMFSSPAIQFKGSGFYITDYAKKSSPDASSGSSGSKSGESKSGGDSQSGESKGGDSKGGDSGSSSSTASKSTDTKSTDSTAKSSPTKE